MKQTGQPPEGEWANPAASSVAAQSPSHPRQLCPRGADFTSFSASALFFFEVILLYFNPILCRPTIDIN